MRFFGWIFLIFGVLNVLFMPIFGVKGGEGYGRI